MRRALALAAALLGLTAGGAQAATLSSVASVVSLSALPGEANRVKVLPARDGGIDLVDAVPLTTGTGCVATSERSAHCPGPVLGVNIDLGDGADTLTADHFAKVALVITGGNGDDVITTGTLADIVDGGAGNDVLQGMEGADRLLGGSGLDTLDGGEGEDTLDGGSENDVLLGDGDVDPARGGADALDGGDGDDWLEGGPRADTLTGGEGRDLASYGDHQSGVTVTLDGESGDGQPGENDDLAGDVEDAVGGAGGDLLVGGPGVNLLDGGDGDDVLRGGDDGDTLEGGPGRDRLTGDGGLDVHRAGAGDDVVDSREPPGLPSPGEVVDCGDGTDTARFDQADSLVACEDAVRDAPPPEPDVALPVRSAAAPPPRGAGSQPPLGVPVLVRGGVILPVICPGTGSCRVRATITASPPRAKRRGRRARGRVVGRVSATVLAGRRVTLTVRLARSGARYVRRARRVRAVATVSLRPQRGATSRWSRPLVLSGRALGS